MRALIVLAKAGIGDAVSYRYVFPLGLAYVVSALKKAGHHVDCLNTYHRAGNASALVMSALDGVAYDVVCLGGTANIYPQMVEIANVVRRHRSRPRLVVGGSIVTCEPELMTEVLAPDASVIGEGEATVVDVFAAFERGTVLSDVRGIAYIAGDGVVKRTTPRQDIADVDTIPRPDFEAFEFGEKIAHSYCNDDPEYKATDYPRSCAVLGSRGCPFRCTFCYHFMKYRARSVDELADEILERVMRYGVNHVCLYDDCFALKRERVYAFCDAMERISAAAGHHVGWQCQLTVRDVSHELLRRMKKAGCGEVCYGFESFSPVVLRSMRKPISPEQIDFALRATLEARIAVQANFILGDVAETAETAQTTLRYWERQGKGQIGLFFVQPYPGSALYQHCLKKGIIRDKLEYMRNGIFSENCINMTNSMTDREVAALRKRMLQLRGKSMVCVSPGKMRRMPELGSDVHAVRTRCPFCGEERTYQNVLIPNRWLFGFGIRCRACAMQYRVASILYRIAHAFGYVAAKRMLELWKSFTKRGAEAG